MIDAAAPGMGIDQSAITADVAKLTRAGFSESEAQAMASGHARQTRNLREIRGELPPIEAIDGDAALADELNRQAFNAEPGERHEWSVRPVSDAQEEIEAAALATTAGRKAATALGLSPGTADTLMQRVVAGLARADTMDEAELEAEGERAKQAFIEKHGTDEAAALARDAREQLKLAGDGGWLHNALVLSGMASDPWTIELLARRWRMRRA